MRFALCSLLLLAPAIAFAQVDRSSLRGVIQDESGAAIPGVNVRMTRSADGLTRETVSTAVGVRAYP